MKINTLGSHLTLRPLEDRTDARAAAKPSSESAVSAAAGWLDPGAGAHGDLSPAAAGPFRFLPPAAGDGSTGSSAGDGATRFASTSKAEDMTWAAPQPLEEGDETGAGSVLQVKHIG